MRIDKASLQKGKQFTFRGFTNIPNRINVAVYCGNFIEGQYFFKTFSKVNGQIMQGDLRYTDQLLETNNFDLVPIDENHPSFLRDPIVNELVDYVCEIARKLSMMSQGR